MISTPRWRDMTIRYWTAIQAMSIMIQTKPSTTERMTLAMQNWAASRLKSRTKSKMLPSKSVWSRKDHPPCVDEALSMEIRRRRRRMMMLAFGARGQRFGVGLMI